MGRDSVASVVRDSPASSHWPLANRHDRIPHDPGERGGVQFETGERGGVSPPVSLNRAFVPVPSQPGG